MEFACEHVYVPPSVSQRDVQRPNANANPVKRSALLPPVSRLRPSIPPPPPPTDSTKAKVQQSSTYETKLCEPLQKNKDFKVTKSNPHYENTEFFKKLAAASPRSVVSSQTGPPKKMALLPSHMRHSANSDSHIQPLNPHVNSQMLTYDELEQQPHLNEQPTDPEYSYTIPEGTGSQVKLLTDPEAVSTAAPPLPPRPSFMKLMNEYLLVLPSPSSSPSTSQSLPSTTPAALPPAAAQADKDLPGNPNVILVSLGKLLSEERVEPSQGKPTSCSQCGSVLDNCYDKKQVKECYFCQWWDLTSSVKSSPDVSPDKLFLLNPDEPPLSSADALLLFCIDSSGSMSITFKVSEKGQVVHKSRLQFVQEAVLQCVDSLSEQQPQIQVGLLTFNYQVTMHGYENCKSLLLSGDELNDAKYLKEAAASFSSPLPLSQTKEYLRKQVMGLSANGETALGPAALLAIAMASRHPGSKVIICTDGKANAKLGNLQEEDDCARTPLSSTIFYQDLGEYAANQGVTVSVLTIEGTDCRLDELGRLADRTGGKVVIASPDRLHTEFEEIIQDRTIATHCAVTLLLPKSLRMRGEREAGHKGTREVGNVNPDTEITMQFGATDQGAVPAPGSLVSIQLQIRYKKSNGQMMLRVFTARRDVTDNSLAALSSLSLAVIQLNSLQASAALAVRGRFLDAKKEGELQQKLIEQATEFNRSTEDKQIYKEWVKTLEPMYKNIHHFTRNKSVASDSQSLTDAGAALLFTMKHSNRKSISLKNKHRL